ncbi:serine/threonine-protein phosphatase 1 regulatory subunit 10 isoform X2 [Diachasma alloeum]|uniref:serine/threonine-protein phosphatase 1 regulatory subunit 10 isoform X1 n=1 Tax=Diachasma alloeum TaxID=454923 RepID=UPI00073814F3|nr:serine/threonine-protein phosphatase 1 regulatory subunit 10 isoform X1 [Diachasma alloeum]XP_015113908.1 serine/threonine-protein phosphatase 1 regulatory subunit 10 isoform X2 [Diachasma alloeum]
MPRIDPLALLNCLSVLLGPSGGIKGTKEVDRLATLMTKFSKKLVSKCIYIQILKTTSTDLLNQFMSTGGWDLIHVWLTDAILAKNWALIQELLELLLLCPVDIARLKSNNNPKLIKGLSKEGAHQGVRLLACRLVEQWLKIVKDSVPTPVDPQQTMAPSHVIPSSQHLGLKPESDEAKPKGEVEGNDISTVKVQDLVAPEASTPPVDQQQSQLHDKISIQPVQLQIVNKTLPGQTQPTQMKKQSFVVVSNPSQNPPSVPVYKITIRDGKQVLTKVETDAANIQSVVNDSPKNVDSTDTVVDNDVVMKSECDDGDVEGSALEDTKDSDGTMSISFKEDNVDAKDVKDCSDSKSNDKENRDELKKEEKTGVEKKSHHSSKGSKHGSSSRSSSHKSHRSSSSSSRGSSGKSSRDKDRHHSSRHSSSSKGKSEREREREKEKMKKDQAEKDKATLEKVQGQSLSTKFGKIPKKKSDEEKTDSSVRKSSTDSRDSSKENKDKTDPKKGPVQGVLEKKNISISIENRKNSLDSSRPKTVKTFNSKFRSTGLEEEVKPPPPRNAGKKPAGTSGNDKRVVLPPKAPLKRSSPLRETAVSDKRAKLAIDAPVTTLGEDKKGAIKLIPAKPKPMVLQESDMFMDALTASTKSKEPRKRKRRSSLSKDDKADGKKTDANSMDAKETTPPPSASPTGADERSPISIKPDFKFYQDTLETDEDKEVKEKDSPDSEKDEDPKEPLRPESLDEDEGSRTPTNEEEVEDPKAPASPDDPEDLPRAPSSPNPEIRYVDGLRSVLLLQKRKGPKKNLKWKEDLESVRYFELDETERVNVTKTFTDMKQMEKQGEREAFQMARKLNTEDVMEEKTRWRLLIPIDLPPPLVEPGKESKEKDIQYAREKGILQALYFNRGMIPDSAAEPDDERHHVPVDPKVIPLDDLTGNKESEKDFTMVPWPEPKPSLIPPPPPVVPSVYHQGYTHPQGMGLPQGMPPPQMPMPMGQPVPPGMMGMNHIVPDVSAGGWRTGDGKVVVPDVNIPGMNNMTNITGFPPPNMMPPPGMFNHQGHHPGHQNPEGFPPMMMEEGNFVGHMPNNFQGPAMFGPGPNFQGPPPRPGMRGRGGPGWFRGGMGPMRGGWPARGNWRGGKQPPVCRQFSKNGFCRVGDKCQYLHPGVNCPPF